VGININKKRSQTHECGNWDCGLAVSFLGIFVSNFRYWFFAAKELRMELVTFDPIPFAFSHSVYEESFLFVNILVKSIVCLSITLSTDCFSTGRVVTGYKENRRGVLPLPVIFVFTVFVSTVFTEETSCTVTHTL